MEEMKHSIDRLWELSSISFSSLEKKIEESISAGTNDHIVRKVSTIENTKS